MLTAVPRILLTGPPRAGMTTLAGKLAGELAAIGVAVGGFLTREIREYGDRVGFIVEGIGGPLRYPESRRRRRQMRHRESLARPDTGS